MSNENTITYKKLDSNDLPALRALISVYEEVFEMTNFQMPNLQYVQGLLEKESMIFFVAYSGSTVIGGLTAHILPSVYFSSSEVYIYDLAIQTQQQRKGIGKTLVHALKRYCSECGYKEIFVQADIEDQHALDFYRSTGGQAESVVHYSYALPHNKQ